MFSLSLSTFWPPQPVSGHQQKAHWFLLKMQIFKKQVTNNKFHILNKVKQSCKTAGHCGFQQTVLKQEIIVHLSATVFLF